MPRSTWIDPGPYSRDAREWFANYLIRVTSIVAPVLGAFLLYRSYLGVLDSRIAALAVILLPSAFLPAVLKYVGLQAKALILLSFFTISAATLFAVSGLLGLGPLLSTLCALTALVFYGNRAFVFIVAVIATAVLFSGLGHYFSDSLFKAQVNLDSPINVVGKTITITLVLLTFLFGLRGATRLVSDQRSYTKQKAQELTRALHELDKFIDSANAPIFGVDTEGRVNEWNAMTAEITGYSREEALGKDLVGAYIRGDHKESVSDVLELALAGENTANYELPLYSRSGERIEVLLNAVTRRDFEGSIIGVIGVGQDITAFREQEKRLLQAEKMETVGHLTGGIAHEFNNLLAVIQGNLDLVLDKSGSQNNSELLQECLSDAAEATADATKLTTQLLSYASQQSFRHESVNLRDLVSESIREIAAEFGDGVEFSLDIGQCDFDVLVDSAQLESSIVNLLENATHAVGASGKIALSVSREFFGNPLDSGYSVQAGEYIVVTVTDDGCGIESSLLSKVADPFYTTRNIGEGAGLGLSIIQGFAKKAHGQLRLQSEVGVGTRVDLALPLVGPGQASDEKQAKGGEVHFARQSGRVLVVEDEERLRKLAARHLSATGFEVLEAGNPGEALSLLAERRGEVDILFSDIRMPGDLSGRDLADEVSKLYPDIRTLLATGYEEEDGSTSDQARSLGSKVPVLRKPYSREELIGALIGLG